MTDTPGLIVAAPHSGSGKTALTLALLRHLRGSGLAVASCKVGPDYIDPKFHEAATGRPCFNLDPWAMRPATLAHVADLAARDADLMVVEGVMGLFDGAADGGGSTADLAAATGWPVVLVMDVRAQAQSAAALLHGFASWRIDVGLAGVIFNRVGSPRHAELLKEAVAPLDIPVLGCLPQSDALALPDRHLGLVQAGEHPDLEGFLSTAAALVGDQVDTYALRLLATRAAESRAESRYEPVPPLGQRIAVANDTAFGFVYPHLLAAWWRQGCEIVPFSPLNDEAPDGGADAVYLPGGYPELHAGRLAANAGFLDGLRAAARRGALVFGECGGYMVLGDGLEDAGGTRHAMAGLLPLETSFARRRRHLGYRRAVTRIASPLGPAGTAWRGHEFHYASIVGEAENGRLFDGWDARGNALGAMGLARGSVMGSFLHLVDRA